MATLSASILGSTPDGEVIRDWPAVRSGWQGFIAGGVAAALTAKPPEVARSVSILLAQLPRAEWRSTRICGCEGAVPHR